MVGARRLRVLVAEDRADWQHILTRTLESAHDVVGHAGRGDLILPMAVELRPDVITLDVSMPGLSGLEALPSIRAALPDAIIVIVTASVDPVYRDEAFARGANEFVTKHRVLSDLLPAIESARMLESNRQRRRA